MKFSVETWAHEYEGAGDPAQLDATTGSVDPYVEVDAAAWGPVDPAATPRPGSVCFIDGVRRIDARIWIEHDGVTRPGACATVAAGVVHCGPDRASVVECRVSHAVFARAEGAGPVLTRHATYELHPVPDDSAEGIYLGIHERMTSLELSLSALDDAELVIFDGPLRGRALTTGVGFVKTQHVRYLPEELEPTIGVLRHGQRTPVFLINQGGATRWSWYLRLPGPVAHAYSGIVRCELPGSGTVADAASRANQVTAMLPDFASEPHKDPRAPQNLYPIAGLERELRRRLGDSSVLERSLRQAAAAHAIPTDLPSKENRTSAAPETVPRGGDL